LPIKKQGKGISSKIIIPVIEGVVLIVLGALTWKSTIPLNVSFGVLLVLIGLRMIFFKNMVY
jgi:hypothetical protein